MSIRPCQRPDRINQTPMLAKSPLTAATTFTFHNRSHVPRGPRLIFWEVWLAEYWAEQRSKTLVWNAIFRSKSRNLLRQKFRFLIVDVYSERNEAFYTRELVNPPIWTTKQFSSFVRKAKLCELNHGEIPSFTIH